MLAERGAPGADSFGSPSSESRKITSPLSRKDLFLKNSYNRHESDITERDLKTAISVFKSNFIRKVLEENNWNQTGTARALAIQRTYLSRLIKELQIDAKI